MARCKTDLSQYSLLLNHKILPFEEERKLLKASQSGDIEARNKLILHNQKLVANIAKTMRRIDVELDDIISEGNLGLMHAITKFDCSRPVKFATYATWWIKNAMHMHLKRRFLIHVPFPQQEMISKIRRGKESAPIKPHAKQRLEQALRITEGTIEEYTISIAARPDANPAEEMREILEQCMSLLTPMEQLVMQHRYLNEKCLTFKEIGALVLLTRARIQQIHIGAIKKLQIHVRDSKSGR